MTEQNTIPVPPGSERVGRSMFGVAAVGFLGAITVPLANKFIEHNSLIDLNSDQKLVMAVSIGTALLAPILGRSSINRARSHQ